jgi:hypothetical protein
MRNVKLVAELWCCVVVCKSDEKCRFDASRPAKSCPRAPFAFLNVDAERRAGKVVIAVICNDFCTLRNADAKWGENDKCLSLFRAKLLWCAQKLHSISSCSFAVQPNALFALSECQIIKASFRAI